MTPGGYTGPVLNFDLPSFLSEVGRRAGQGGDVLLGVGLPPCVLTDGELKRVEIPGLPRLSPYQTEAVVLNLLASAPAAAAEKVQKKGAAAFAYSIPGVNRFRVAVFQQRGSFGVTLRSIPDRVPSLAELELVPAVAEATQERTGVVLVNGPAGSGRTTTLAALVGEINRTRACHVMTVEEPIEFLHKHEKAAIFQREVGIDTPSLSQGLVDAAAAGAEVIMASEVRTPDEARAVLELAETGHLLLTSLRGYDTASALSRFLSLFPPEERPEARMRLSRVLRFCFTQRLLPHRDGKRRPVFEVFRQSVAASEFLAQGRLDSATVSDFLRDGEKEGQQSFDRELERKVRRGELDAAVALEYAVLPRQLELRLLDLKGA